MSKAWSKFPWSVRAVKVEPEAAELLARFPWATLEPLFLSLNDWSTRAPVSSLHIAAVREPDDVSWKEVVLEFCLSADLVSTLQLWQGAALAVDSAKSKLEPEQRRALDRMIGVHLTPVDFALA